ncbi:hypothetical protein NDU88_003753 [Pleurodeles waltl]|uniref:Uncharacterized protein n=1 Tax=Pleurodeles waltl TaxID=8319 RepID=A0AAV7WT66_PLEWA|nr:hypothetical protein NDU88_003753 [Pleurodeles waltl]
MAEETHREIPLIKFLMVAPLLPYDIQLVKHEVSQDLRDARRDLVGGRQGVLPQNSENWQVEEIIYLQQEVLCLQQQQSTLQAQAEDV